jgi:hypothetical protein
MGTPDPYLREEEIICNTTRTMQGVTYPAYPFLKNIPGASGEKTQISYYRTQGTETLIKNNSRCINFNAE